MSGDQELIDSDTIKVTVRQITSDDLHQSPPAKKHKNDQGDPFEISQNLSVKQILYNINKSINQRMDSVEKKLEALDNRFKIMEDKLEAVLSNVGLTTDTECLGQQHLSSSDNSSPVTRSRGSASRRHSTIIVGMPSSTGTNTQSTNTTVETNESTIKNKHRGNSLGSNVQLIPLNNEEDYPGGSWLGEESNSELRVRCCVAPNDMLHINTTCRSPEKMALTLLDYLFDRDTQANSNISGTGKHGKKQLNPLMIYGIRCHLIYKFGINETDWHRIKQNIDSKCRTAFRRKQRGQPLGVKAFARKASSPLPQQGEIFTTEYDGKIQHLRILQDSVLTGESDNNSVQLLVTEHVENDSQAAQHIEQMEQQMSSGEQRDQVLVSDNSEIHFQQGSEVTIPSSEIQIAVNPEVQIRQLPNGQLQIQPIHQNQ